MWHMNRDAPLEIISAARFHEAGPFVALWDAAPDESDMRSRICYARVQYFPKASKFSRAVGLRWKLYDRAEAWEILSKQQIPGCPDDGQNHWRKMHTENYWAWYYEAGT
jgi:hypothetical protein